MSAIFNNLPPELNRVIFLFCDLKSLINLSEVSEGLKAFLSNEFFKDYFFIQHPQLQPSNDRIFSVLRSTHPSNCWKVMSQVMDAQWECNRKILSFAGRLSPAFIKEADDKVNQAWEKLKTANLEFLTLSESKYREIENKFTPKDKGVFNRIFEKRGRGDAAKNFASISYEEFLQTADVEDKEISRDQFSLYQEAVKQMLSMRDKTGEITTLKHELSKLIGFDHSWGSLSVRLSDRAMRDESVIIKSMEQEWVTFYSTFAADHLKKLNREYIYARELENRKKNEELLAKLCDSLEKLIKLPAEERTPNVLEEIRRLINTCTEGCRKHIWASLYFQCANRVIEESWAEKHFQDFLPQLREIVKAIIPGGLLTFPPLHPPGGHVPVGRGHAHHALPPGGPGGHVPVGRGHAHHALPPGGPGGHVPVERRN